MKNSYYAYIRVSTPRQGERGVSLPEQREAILRFAQRQGLTISEWFEEQQTAAKRGRPVWTKMLKLLRLRKARGVIIHKIDRSARNLRDWADLGELIDQGIEVQFANEALDLNSRGGRLSADIQAVVASDYIRNLREEAKKGIYGRLKQGFYPLRAPLGYRDNGGGKPKTICPAKGPLVKLAFDLYASAKWSIPLLVDEMYRRGLRNVVGKKVSQNGLWTILKNPFYAGVIRIRRTNQSFPGNHEPLIAPEAFKRVQAIMTGRYNARVHVHDFQFRRTIVCKNCKYHLIGERQKGHVYYRCHTKSCPPTSVREEVVASLVATQLKRLQFTQEEKKYLQSISQEMNQNSLEEQKLEYGRLTIRKEKIAERLASLTDAYLEHVIEKDLYEERKAALLLDRAQITEILRRFDQGANSVGTEVNKYIELAESSISLYRTATPEQSRDFLKSVTSNLTIERKTLELAFSPPFNLIAEREPFTTGRPSLEIRRTLERFLDKLTEVIRSLPKKEEPEPEPEMYPWEAAA